MKFVRMPNIALACAIVLSSQIGDAQNNVGNFYTGEVKVDVVGSYSGTPVLPKTEKVVIQDFTVNSGAVNMDESAAGRMHTLLSLGREPDDPAAAATLAQQVQNSFAKALVSDLKKANIEAQRSTDTKKGSTEPLLLVGGEVTAIDEGNKVKRVMVGLGRGASLVQTHVLVSSVANRHSTVVLELNLKSESGKKLGALETMGGGSLAVGAATGDVGDKQSTVQADAARMAKGVAKQIQKFMVDQKWLPAAPPATGETHPDPASSSLVAQSAR